MKREILIPSVVISIFSLMVGLFILSFDRLQSAENTRIQPQQQNTGNRLAAESRQTIEEHSHLKRQFMKRPLVSPDEQRRQKDVWI